MAYGLWPICWIVFSAVLFYNLSVESGDFDVIRRSLARLTTDRRVQVLLVAFCFGALIEGIAGFGAPVAITASMLAGLGFEPIMAAVLALIANTAPVAFGSLGIPVTTLGGCWRRCLATTRRRRLVLCRRWSAASFPSSR
jgi:L-lactate permease